MMKAVIFLLATLAQAGDFPKPAMVTGDAIRIREKPSEKGKYVGVLYKNMKVDVLEKGEGKVSVEGQEYPWLHVKVDGVEGWCAGKYLDFNPASWSADTYASSGDMAWFETKYGDATAFAEAALNEKSFTVSEYRDLIASAEEKFSRSASSALSRTVYPYLQKNPSDPGYAYLKKKLFAVDTFVAYAKNRNCELLKFVPESLQTEDTLEKLLTQGNAKSGGCCSSLPKKMLEMDSMVKIAFKVGPPLLACVSPERWKDREFALRAMKVKPELCGHLPDNLKYEKAFLSLMADHLDRCAIFLDPDKIGDVELQKKVKKKIDQENMG